VNVTTARPEPELAADSADSACTDPEEFTRATAIRSSTLPLASSTTTLTVKSPASPSSLGSSGGLKAWMLTVVPAAKLPVLIVPAVSVVLDSTLL